MTGNINLIGVNVRRIRDSKGLNQGEVAKKAGLSRAAYQKIERGDSVPRVDSLQSIADALDVRVWELMEEPLELAAVRFRSQKKMRTREQILVKVARWLQNFNDLEEVLGRKESFRLQDAVQELRKKKSRPVSADHPVKAAELVREKLRLGHDGAIQDICDLFEWCGIKMYPVCIRSEGFFGLSVAPEDGGPAVVVNTERRIPVERWIFSAAHELGHLLLHRDSFDVQQSEELKEEEDEADQFASVFLMPQEAFLAYWNRSRGLNLLDRVFKVKRIFLVSYKTVLRRLVENGLADNSIWRRFNGLYRRRYGKGLAYRDEPQGLRPDKFASDAQYDDAGLEPHKLDPSDFVVNKLHRLVREALERDAITVSRAAEILELDLESTRELVASWSVTDGGIAGAV